LDDGNNVVKKFSGMLGEEWGKMNVGESVFDELMIGKTKYEW
jgi:hypothetical protein